MTPWTIPTRLLCPWDFPGKNTGWNGLSFLSSGDLPDPGIKPKSLHCRWILYPWATKEARNIFNKELKSVHVCVCVCVCVLVAQSCPSFCNSMDYSPPGSSVHGILQARILECVAVPFSRGSSQSRESNLGLQRCRQILYHLSHQERSTKKRKQVLAATCLGLGLSTGEDCWDHRDSKRQIFYWLVIQFLLGLKPSLLGSLPATLGTPFFSNPSHW